VCSARSTDGLGNRQESVDLVFAANRAESSLGPPCTPGPLLRINSKERVSDVSSGLVSRRAWRTGKIWTKGEAGARALCLH